MNNKNNGWSLIEKKSDTAEVSTTTFSLKSLKGYVLP